MEKSSFLSTLGKHKFVMAALLAVGIVLIVAGSLGTKDSSVTETSERVDYESMLERRLEELCLSVEGINEAKILVTVDKTLSTYSTSGGFGVSSYRAEDTTLPTVRGVAAVVTGGNNAAVKKTLTELIASSLGIPTSRVSIAPCK